VLAGIMRASGTVLVPTLISIVAILCVELPVAYGLSGHFGINGVWAAYPIAYIAMLTMQASYYWFVWRKKTIQRMV